VQELLVHQIELEMQNDELRRTQAVLEAAHDRYEDLYDFAPVGYLTLDGQGNIVDANIMAGTLLGFSRNKLIGKSFARFVTPEDQGTLHHHVQDVLEGGSQRFCEVKLRRHSGRPSYLLLKSLAMRDESGRHTGWRTALLDISERKQAEADLKKVNDELTQANERFGWVMRAINDGVWDWDLVHDVLYYSPRWKEMHGFSQVDVVEHIDEWVGRIHPDDRKSVLGRLQDYLHGRLPEFREEYRIRRKDGIWMWVLDRGVAIFNEQGRAVRIIGAEKDITWRKEVEQTIRRREQEFHALADNVPALFSYIDSKRRYRFVNRRHEELFQGHSEEILGSTVQNLLGPEGYVEVEPHLDAAFGGQEQSFEYRLRLPEAGERWFSARYMPDRDEQGRVVGIFALLTDVTTLKRSEGELQEKKRQLRTLSARLLQAREEEQRRIARELHDDFTQRLASLAIDLRTISRGEPCAGSPLDSRLQQLGGLAERLAADLQQMAHQLHPSILEHVGLEAAVREQVDEFISRTGLKTEIIVKKMPSAVRGEEALCLYRVLQEGLRNVQKHADATHVVVRLLGTSKGLGLCIHDDGRGFECEGGVSHRKGLGVTSMEERLSALRGMFRLRAKPGAGTEIHAWVPLEGETGESQ
jgi:PAS domain S-box-containing protein